MKDEIILENIQLQQQLDMKNKFEEINQHKIFQRQRLVIEMHRFEYDMRLEIDGHTRSRQSTSKNCSSHFVFFPQKKEIV